MATTKPTTGPKATIKEWLEQLPDGYREQALENFKKYENEDNALCSDMGTALDEAFHWGHTPEGVDYWGAVYTWCSGEGELPEL